MSEVKSIVGILKCGVCKSPVQLKLSKKERVFYTCSACSLQVFSRGKKSSDIMIKKAKKPENPIREKEPEKAVQESGGFWDFVGGDDE